MRAKEFINEQVSAKYIFDLAKKVHRKLDDFSDGDLTDRIYWFDQYTLTELPVSKINTHEFDVDEDLAAKHTAKIMKSTDTMPPIIYDPIAKSIIDGIHRVNAYKKLGYKTIPAYVGSKKSQSYGQLDNIDEARLDEVPLPADWDKEQLNLRQTFKNRIAYAVSKAQRIGAGGSRIAFIIPYEGRNTVLKVAKNLKGLAQNEAEIQVLDDYVVGQSDIVIPLIDYDKDNKRPVWLQTELASQISMKPLLQLLRTPTLWFLTDAIKYRLALPNKPKYLNKPADLKEKYFDPEMWSYGGQPTEQSFEMFKEYIDKLAELIDSAQIELGDLQDNSNWGQFMGRPVVIDLGLTSDVWNKYYNKYYSLK